MDTLTADREKVAKRLSDIDQKLAAVKTTLGLLAERRVAQTVSTVDSVLESLIKKLGFNKARNHNEALKIIATRGDGKVNATQAADMLLAVGKSNSKRRNLVSHLYAKMSNSDEWILNSPGTFRYVGKNGQRPERSVTLDPKGVERALIPNPPKEGLGDSP